MFFEGKHPSQRRKHFSLSYLSINQSISQSADVCEALNRSQRRFKAQNAADASRAAGSRRANRKNSPCRKKPGADSALWRPESTQLSQLSRNGVELNRQPSPCTDIAGVKCRPRSRDSTRGGKVLTFFALRNVASLSGNAAACLLPPLRKTLRVKLFGCFFCFAVVFFLWSSVTETRRLPVIGL